MKKSKSILLWAVAFLLTVTIAGYQRRTGPTKPLKNLEIINGSKISYSLLRSFERFRNAPVEINDPSGEFSGILEYKRLRVEEDWTPVKMIRQAEKLIGTLPGQPAAGKLEYRIILDKQGKRTPLNGNVPVAIRFKGRVPLPLLLIHIVFMFSGILLGIRTGMEALHTQGRYGKLVAMTLIVTAVGGLFLGPLIQKLAFGDWWTGLPFGRDLTDNKTIFIVLVWTLAFFLRKKSRWLAVSAASLMILIYLIPHSLFGSEFNYKTGRVETGKAESVAPDLQSRT